MYISAGLVCVYQTIKFTDTRPKKRCVIARSDGLTHLLIIEQHTVVSLVQDSEVKPDRSHTEPEVKYQETCLSMLSLCVVLVTRLWEVQSWDK